MWLSIIFSRLFPYLQWKTWKNCLFSFQTCTILNIALIFLRTNGQGRGSDWDVAYCNRLNENTRPTTDTTDNLKYAYHQYKLFYMDLYFPYKWPFLSLCLSVHIPVRIKIFFNLFQITANKLLSLAGLHTGEILMLCVELQGDSYICYVVDRFTATTTNVIISYTNITT